MDLFCLEDPLELEWPDENDSQKIKEILDANENVDDLFMVIWKIFTPCQAGVLCDLIFFESSYFNMSV